VSPLEVARTRLQAQRVTIDQTRAPYYRGTYGTIRTIIAEEGIRGCYRGMGVNIMALAPNWFASLLHDTAPTTARLLLAIISPR
jgi:hypothetical protein